MEILTLIVLGAAVRFDFGGHEVLIYDGRIRFDGQVVGTAEFEQAGKSLIVTYSLDGRKALAQSGVEADAVDVPAWLDGELRLGELSATPNHLIWQPLGGDGYRIAISHVEACLCSDETAPPGQCDPNDCNGDCGAGGPGNVCRWVTQDPGGCTMPSAMLILMLVPLMLMRRRQ